MDCAPSFQPTRHWLPGLEHFDPLVKLPLRSNNMLPGA